MMHGDISNKGSFNIGFRCENTLLRPKEGLAVIPSLFFGKWKNADVDSEVYSIMHHIYWNTEYSISLVVNDSTFNSKGFEDFILDFPFNQILTVIKSISEVESWLNIGNITYFVTDNESDWSILHSQYMMRPEEFRRNFVNYNKVARNRELWRVGTKQGSV